MLIRVVSANDGRATEARRADGELVSQTIASFIVWKTTNKVSFDEVQMQTDLLSSSDPVEAVAAVAEAVYVACEARESVCQIREYESFFKSR